MDERVQLAPLIWGPSIKGVNILYNCYENASVEHGVLKMKKKTSEDNCFYKGEP